MRGGRGKEEGGEGGQGLIIAAAILSPSPSSYTFFPPPSLPSNDTSLVFNIDEFGKWGEGLFKAKRRSRGAYLQTPRMFPERSKNRIYRSQETSLFWQVTPQSSASSFYRVLQNICGCKFLQGQATFIVKMCEKVSDCTPPALPGFSRHSMRPRIG